MIVVAKAAIPEAELSESVADALRRAEAGERLTITVNGRAVAELGPVGSRPPMRRGATAADLRRIQAMADPEWAEDLRRMRAEDRANAVDIWVEH